MVNDVKIAGTIAFTFIMLGLLLPFVNDAFNSTATNFNTDGLQTGSINEDFEDTTSVSAGDVFKSIIKMFFWTFGDLPFWLDAVFLVFRLMLLMILVKNFVPFLGGG